MCMGDRGGVGEKIRRMGEEDDDDDDNIKKYSSRSRI